MENRKIQNPLSSVFHLINYPHLRKRTIVFKTQDSLENAASNRSSKQILVTLSLTKSFNGECRRRLIKAVMTLFLLFSVVTSTSTMTTTTTIIRHKKIPFLTCSIATHRDDSVATHRDGSIIIHWDYSIATQRDDCIPTNRYGSIAAHRDGSIVTHWDCSIAKHRDGSIATHRDRSKPTYRESMIQSVQLHTLDKIKLIFNKRRFNISWIRWDVLWIKIFLVSV